MYNREQWPAEAHETGQIAVVCLSHLRWDFVYQRPQHLMSRFARDARVFFIEEPIAHDGPDRLEVTPTAQDVMRVVPRLHRPGEPDAESRLAGLLDRLLEEYDVDPFVLWYYTPMALGFTDHMQPRAVVYDVMDELSAFAYAPPALVERERALLRRADVVFTGGPGLYDARRALHPNVHCHPSSIDVDHFRRAREPVDDPHSPDLPRPRVGFFGVLDERLDRELLGALPALRPDWQFVLVGPVAKIDPADLPAGPNLHYEGFRSYDELPALIGNWDVAIMPWARNDATRFISPTKTPEYLAAGRPVVATPVPDIVRLYGDSGLVRLADTPESWVNAIQECLHMSADARRQWLEAVDERLATMSWDRTWMAMRDQIDEVLGKRSAPAPHSPLDPAGARSRSFLPDHADVQSAHRVNLTHTAER